MGVVYTVTPIVCCHNMRTTQQRWHQLTGCYLAPLSALDRSGIQLALFSYLSHGNRSGRSCHDHAKKIGDPRCRKIWRGPQWEL